MLKFNQPEHPGYVVLRNQIDKHLLQIMKQYYQLHFLKPGYYSQKDESFNRYADLLGESFLVTMRDTIQNVVGTELYPTYSYTRIYKTGAKLAKHRDRKACEITVSIAIDNTPDLDWPIFMDTAEGGTKVVLNPGDLIIFKGAQIPHWREPFKGESCTQLFLHYVSCAGEHANHKYDKRMAIGLEKHVTVPRFS